MNLTVVIDPTDDYVRTDSPVVPRESKTHVSLGLHLYLERDFPLTGRPQNEKIVVQHCAVFPLDTGHIVQ